MLKRSKIEDDDELESAGPGARSSQVLVVNTDSSSLELVCRLIEREGWTAHRSTIAEGVVDELAERPFAGLVLDLPDLDSSLEIVRELRASGGEAANTPVLVLTSTGGDESAALRAGADGFLARPFHADELHQQAELVLGSL